MPSDYSYHNSQVILFDVVETYEFEPASNSKIYRHAGPQNRAEVPEKYNWPTHCACGYAFKPEDEWQVFSDHLYRRSDTETITTLSHCGPGAMWNAEYLADNPEMVGPDGLSLHVNCPNGVPWSIDGRARNCDSPCATCGVAYNSHTSTCQYRDARPHKCWIRHGTPPMITVDKAGGATCGAGAGSIQAGNYHGFLRNGVFTNA